jgi:16S rRNA (guanine527-N7)-methyltransferase
MSGKEGDILFKYFPELDKRQLGLYGRLGDLYRYWNERINVISRKDTDNLYLHHVIHSLAIVKFIRFDPGLRVLDIGTGGGFPGIPLAIYYPKLNFELIDGTNKKITVVNEIISSLGLNNAIAFQSRSEELKEKYDIITGRAVTDTNDFISKALFLLRKSKSDSSGIYYWSGTLPKKSVNKSFDLDVFKIEKVFDEEYFKGKYIVRGRWR